MTGNVKTVRKRKPVDAEGVRIMRNLLAASSLILAFVCVAAPLGAAEWSNSASVTPGVTYTDNVCLSSNNTQDQWIGTVTPSGTVRGKGNNANVSLTASVEVNTLTDSKLKDQGCSGGSFGDRDQFAPRLRGGANAVLVDQWLFIDSSANISQNQVSPFVRGGGDSFDRTGNTNTTYNYSVSPYVARRFKDVAQLNIRYTWDDQYNSTNVVGDSTRESWQGLLGSIPGTSSFLWGIQGDYSKVSYSDERFSDVRDNQDSELKSAQLNLGYQLSRRWQVNGFYGQEWNDFVSNRDDIDGTFWDVGVRWTPTSRTTVDAGVGDRFFGSNPRFSIKHSHKRSAFSASYAKDLTYDRDIRTLDDSPPLNPGFPSPPEVDPGLTTVTNSPILDERYTLAYSFQGLRTRFGVSAFQSEQTREGDSLSAFSKATYTGVSVNANRPLSPEISLNGRISWNEQEPENSNSNTPGRFSSNAETWIASVGLAHRLGQRTTLGLNYQYTDRQSDSAIDEYTENRITLDLKIDL
jgi:uncharacterized protein (PEP-CTERM system associated)